MAVGINVTHQVILSGKTMEDLSSCFGHTFM